jgi:hypothetical protein
MKKLQLNLDMLSVDSFEMPEAEQDERGTVKGQEAGALAAAPSYLDVTICPTSCRCPVTY